MPDKPRTGLKWISVEEKLPLMWQTKIIAVTEYWKSETRKLRYSTCGYLVGEAWRDRDGHSIEPERTKVTHWADWPEPPLEKVGE